MPTRALPAEAEVVPRRHRAGGCHILYDQAAISAPGQEFFEPVHWGRAGAVTGVAEGRGAVCIFTFEGEEYVLRHYRRGGWMARLSVDRYAWWGLERTRAWREWRLLAWMRAEGLPVPRPVAARVVRRGMAYTADLVTCRLPRTWPLADLLMRWPLPESSWSDIGATIARMHAAGVCHADLNARNVLLDDAGEVFLVDFDKADSRALAGVWRRSNLTRLHRSLAKFHAADRTFHFDESAWESLLAGYSGRRDGSTGQGR